MERRIIDLGGPDGGRFWRVVSDVPIDHPDARAAAVHARMTGSIGCTYNGVRVKRYLRKMRAPGQILFLVQRILDRERGDNIDIGVIYAVDAKDARDRVERVLYRLRSDDLEKFRVFQLHQYGLECPPHFFTDMYGIPISKMKYVRRMVAVYGPNAPQFGREEFHVHAEGCSDTNKSLYDGLPPILLDLNSNPGEPLEGAVVGAIYADQIKERIAEGEVAKNYLTEFMPDFKFFPCVEEAR